MSQQQQPDRRSIFAVLAIGLVLVAVFSLIIGDSSASKVIERLVVYGGAFLLLVFVLDRSRRPRG
jgi:hypothetical protein